MENKNIEDEISKVTSELFGIEYEEEVIDYTDSNDEFPFDADKIRIDQRMLSVKYILELIGDGLIDLTPGFQRHIVWKENKRKSALIESVMLRIPIPAFYFYEDEDTIFHVIDGLQRLSTIRDFVQGMFSLSNLEYLHNSCDKQYFNDLDQKYKTRIYQTQLAVNIIDSRTPQNVKYDLFKRINTGGIPLNSQEIRNCTAKENVRELLKLMADSDAFMLATDNSIKDTRMDDQELALRFIVFYDLFDFDNMILRKFSQSIEQLMNDKIDYLNTKSMKELEKYILLFENSMRNAYKMFEELSFRKVFSTDFDEEKNYIGRRKPINKALFTSISVLCSQLEFDEIPYHHEYYNSYTENLINLLDNDELFYNSISINTGSYNSLNHNFTCISSIIIGK